MEEELYRTKVRTFCGITSSPLSSCLPGRFPLRPLKAQLRKEASAAGCYYSCHTIFQTEEMSEEVAYRVVFSVSRGHNSSPRSRTAQVAQEEPVRVITWGINFQIHLHMLACHVHLERCCLSFKLVQFTYSQIPRMQLYALLHGGSSWDFLLLPHAYFVTDCIRITPRLMFPGCCLYPTFGWNQSARLRYGDHLITL